MENITKDMTAEAIYDVVKKSIHRASSKQINAVCKAILEAPGDRALIIYRGKKDG